MRIVNAVSQPKNLMLITFACGFNVQINVGKPMVLSSLERIIEGTTLVNLAHKRHNMECEKCIN